MTTTTAQQYVEVEASNGQWQRVPVGSPAAQLHEANRALRANARRLDGMGRQFAAAGAKIGAANEIRSARELETAHASGTLTRGQAWRYIEREAAQLATREGLSKSQAIESFCEKNPRAYAAYREARPDSPTPKPAPATPPAPTGAAGEIETKARAYAEAQNVTFAAAMVAVAEQNPELYRRHVAEQRARSAS